MKISVITVTYNSADTVRDTIDSVLGQDYPFVEYIVVDGNSSDGTVEIVKSYGDRISKFISEPDRGIYDALNKGISMATGDVIGFMHSDDTFTGSDVLKTVAEAFETGNTDSVYGDLVYVNKQDPWKVIRHWRSGSITRQKVERGWMPPHPTFYVRSEIYRNHGGFNTDYRISADYDFMVRMLHKKNISTCYIPMIMVKMRVGGKSNRSLSNIIKKVKEDVTVMKSNGLNFWVSILYKNLSKINQFIPSRDIRNQVTYHNNKYEYLVSIKHQ